MRVGRLLHYGGIAVKILRFWVGFVWCLCEFVFVAAPAQERYACEVEGVDADFLLLMAGVVKSGVCSKARCVVDIGMLRIWRNFSGRLLYVEDYQDKGPADVVGMSDRPAQASNTMGFLDACRHV